MAAPPSPLGLARRVSGAGAATPAAAWSSSCRPRRLRPRLLPSKRWSGVVRMGAAVGGEQEGEDEEVKLAKEMAAARRRWETLIREQKIKTLTPREAGYTFKLTDKVLLDVRPSNERQKAWVKGSTWIPVFDVDTSFDLGGAGKKFTNYVMACEFIFQLLHHPSYNSGHPNDRTPMTSLGGWWSGSSTMTVNKNFVQQVEEKFSKDTDIIVVCQKGLRSLAACEQLYGAGFQNLFWVQGGLEAAEEEDFEREGPQPFKLAGIGGVSEFFGWTDQQRAQAVKEGLGYRLIFTGRLVGALVLVDALFLGAQRIGPLLQELQSR
uniref:Rhodanese domain-containing protein n=2 Tax=Oryza TaxID=4527 RepID=A0A0D3F751_9ORYZ